MTTRIRITRFHDRRTPELMRYSDNLCERLFAWRVAANKARGLAAKVKPVLAIVPRWMRKQAL